MSDNHPQNPPGEMPELRNLEDIVTANDAEKASEYLESLPLSESFRVLTEMGENEQKQLLTLLPDEDAAALIEQLPESHAALLIAQLPAGEAAAIIDAMHSDEQADVIALLDPAAAEAILEEMDPAEATDVRRRVEFPGDTAGGLMITEFLCYQDHLRVDDVLNDLRDNAERYAAYDVQYAYVVSKDQRLVGVLRLRDLLLSSRQTLIASVMIRQPLWVYAHTVLVELGHFFDRHPLFGAPVTDDEGRLLGVVRRADVEEAAEERANQTLLKFMGILGGEELRSVPLRTRCIRRLSWLSVNIVLNIVAASVIALNQDTLAAVIALGVVMPIISDMSGCAGTQAIAVTMRELSLGLVRPKDLWPVLRKEALLGVINGFVLGLVLAVMGILWKGSAALGLVVGSALAVNTIFACCAGGTIPLVLRRFRFDPALASSPILTTCTDMCGFFLVLSFAKLLLPYLQGI